MEMIKISRDKLKVMMTSHDMEKYELDIDKMSYDDINTRTSIGKILEKAKQICGFESVGNKMLIKIFPSRDGGCEIFVSAINSEKSLNENDSDKIYSFATMKELIKCCYLMSKICYSGESSVYSCATNGNCYLVFNGQLSDVVGEFADKYSNKQFAYKYKEHLVPIIEGDAVHMLAKYYV